MRHDTPAATRLHQLDGLRALAVAGVVAQHSFGTMAGSVVQHGFAFVGVHAQSDGVELAGMGVRLFFVLSGYLITGILLRARDAAAERGFSRWTVWRAFYYRRALRIFPLAYAVLALAWLIGAPTIRAHPWMYLTYTSNFHVASHGFTDPSLDHFWTLAIEEQFYLFWPLVLLAMPERWVWAAISTAIGVSMCARGVILVHAGSLPSYIPASVLTPSRLDALAIGGLMAWYQSRHPQLTRRVVIGLAIGGLGARVVSHLGPQSAVLSVLQETGNVLLSAAVVFAASRSTGIVGRLLSARPLVAIGTVSYGIYVYHMVIAGLAPIVAARFGLPAFYPDQYGWQRFAWMVGTTLPIAAASWRWFERPLNDLKSRYPYVPAAVRPDNAHARSVESRSSVASVS